MRGVNFLFLLVWFRRGGVATRAAGEEYSKEENNPAKGHNEPENVFDAQAGGGAGRSVDEIPSQNEYISPEQRARSLPPYEFPGGVDSHANHSQDTKRVHDDNRDEPCPQLRLQDPCPRGAYNLAKLLPVNSGQGDE